MNIFNWRFKLRVKNYIDDMYTIQYAYYRFIPNWKNIKVWNEVSLSGDTHGWKPLTLTCSKAESYVMKISSMDDIIDIINKEKEKEKIFYKRRGVWYNKNPHYKTKRLK